MRFRISLVAVAAAAALVALPTVALASHGKIGLWNVTVTVHAPGIPEMSQQDMAQMKKLGMRTPNGRTIAAQHCMRAAEVASDTLTVGAAKQQGCAMNNLKAVGHTMSGDMVCTGAMKGRGHIAITYDSPGHYAGGMTFKGTANGQPANVKYVYDGKWIAADCGKISH